MLYLSSCRTLDVVQRCSEEAPSFAAVASTVCSDQVLTLQFDRVEPKALSRMQNHKTSSAADWLSPQCRPLRDVPHAKPFPTFLHNRLAFVGAAKKTTSAIFYQVEPGSGFEQEHFTSAGPVLLLLQRTLLPKVHLWALCTMRAVARTHVSCSCH